MNLGSFRCLALFAALAAGSAMATNDEREQLLDEAREAAQDLIQQIGGELRREYELSGALRSVVVCKYLAPEVSSAISRRHGAQVRRVSLHVRNPMLGMPDAWEQAVLLDFERRQARGEKAERMEFSEVVKEPQGSFFRYMKAIPTAEVCLACHGPAEALSPATQAQLANDYPHDKGRGHVVGSVRGAVSFKKPM